MEFVSNIYTCRKWLDKPNDFSNKRFFISELLNNYVLFNDNNDFNV